MNTPALIIDNDAFERNLDRMARHCREAGLHLRPHAKTHKSIEIARRQAAAGAVGICCAKLGEAEVLASGGIGSILLTSPVVTAEGGRRLAGLNEVVPELSVVVDSPENLSLLAEAAQESGQPLHVLVDIDVGLHRTGISPGVRAAELAESITRSPQLRLGGIQGYAGHLMHLPGRSERELATREAMDALARTRNVLRQRGLPCDVVTGGGTGTFDIEPRIGALTELQAGSYLFMDTQYAEIWETGGESVPFETSLFVQTTVISSNIAGHATTDAGTKAFATDAGLPRVVDGAPPGTRYVFLGDEQGGLELPETASRPAPGAVITCAAPHCDPTVNLYDEYHVVKGDTLVEIWPVDARGRSQ